MTAPVVSLDVSAVPGQPAGAGRYIVELVRALGPSPAIDLALVARRGDAARWRQIAPAAPVRAVVPTPRPVRLGFEQLGGMRMAQRALGAQLHHGPHYTMPRFSPLPTVVTIHDMTFFDHPEVHESSKVAYFRRAIAFAARHAAVLVCVSERTAEGLRSHVEVRAPIVVAHHGIDHARFSPLEAEPGSDARHLGSLELAADRPRLVALGTMEPRKGLLKLVGAFEQLSVQVDDLELVLAGQRGWGVDELDRAIARSPVRDRIRVLGYVPDEVVPALLRNARAVVYPSIDEGFGLPALEGLACGAPVVTTAGSVMAELCGPAAWLTIPGSVDSLAEVIGSVLGASEHELVERRMVGIDVASRFTWEATARAHLTAYAMALGTNLPENGH